VVPVLPVMGKKKPKAPPKPWQNEFEGLSVGMESFWRGAAQGIYERRGDRLLEELEKISNTKGEELACPKSGFAIMPSQVLSIPSLTSIDFHGNLLSEDNMPEEFWTTPSLSNLKVLDLSSNRLNSIPDDREEIGMYKNLGKLEVLRLSNNGFTELPSELKYLTSLREVAINNNVIQDFREEWSAWTELRTLDISNNEISAFPSSMCNWSELRVLRAKYCKLICMPDTLGACTKLRILNLSNNPALADLPESIVTLVLLEELDLTRCAFNALPEQMQFMSSLRKFYAGHNSLKPPSVNHICGLTKLEDLFLPKNLLTTIPKDIGNLVNLRRVSFSANKMKALPSEVGEWTKIEEVYLSNNEFDKLPNSCAEWVNLVELNVSKCLTLSQVPLKIAYPLTLMRFDLRDTQVELPDEWQPPPKGEIPTRIPPMYIVGGLKGGGKKK